MAEVVGYILTGPDGEVQRWGGTWGQLPGVPNPLFLPNGDQVHAPVVGADYDGYSLSEWLMDEPAPVAPSVPTLCCLANLMIDGGAVDGVDTATGISFGFMADTNILWLFFNEPFDVVNYGWNVSSTSGTAKVTDRQTGYIEITASDTTEPFALSVQIYKVV